jgi:hypothetical protein
MAKRKQSLEPSAPVPDSSGGAKRGRAPEVRRIGLSLGADICWPLCYEEIARRLDLDVRWKGRQVRVDVERVTIEPFALAKPCSYDVVLDRLTHWYLPTREWLKKAVVMDDVYVLNNPWAIQSMEKHSTYAAMTRLGMPVPTTWMIPPKTYTPVADLRPTLKAYAKLFDLRRIGDEIGYPLFMKPYDGGAWRGVSLIRNEAELLARYEESGTQLMHLQKAVHPWDRFVRCVGIGPQTRLVNYDPDAPLHDRYTMERDFVSADDESVLRDMTLTINAFFGWDFNSCEALRSDGTWYPIDFANACPDSQVTSLHYHFPWLVIAKLRWSLYCAITKRKMAKTLDWEPFLKVAAVEDMPWREKLRAYARIAEKRLETDDFGEFCDKHLGHLEEVAWDFFASDAAKVAFRQKVAALYPAHEVEPFTELFFNRVQAWRAHNVPASRRTE